jgi:hypothetical protein
MNDLIPIQSTFDWFALTELGAVEEEGLRRVASQFLRTNLSRLAHASRLTGGFVPAGAGRLLSLVVRKELVGQDYCDVLAAPMAEQTERIFGPEGVADEAVVRRLAEVIAGRVDIGVADGLLDEGVVSHLDGWTVRGRPAWRTWLCFLRSRRRVPDLDLVDVRTETLTDGRVRLNARWRTRDGTSDDVASATYRVERSRIVEIWTARQNYAFILGPIARWRLGMLLVFAYVGLTSRFHRDVGRAASRAVDGGRAPVAGLSA